MVGPRGQSSFFKRINRQTRDGIEGAIPIGVLERIPDIEVVPVPVLAKPVEAIPTPPTILLAYPSQSHRRKLSP